MENDISTSDNEIKEVIREIQNRKVPESDVKGK